MIDRHTLRPMSNWKMSRVYWIRPVFVQQFYLWLSRDLDNRPTIFMNQRGASHDSNYSVAVNQTPIFCHTSIKVFSLGTPHIDVLSFTDMNSEPNVPPGNLRLLGCSHISWWVPRPTKHNSSSRMYSGFGISRICAVILNGIIRPPDGYTIYHSSKNNM